MKKYYIMDGRANFNPDRAIVCDVCNSLEEAREQLKSWPSDHVIVDSDTWEIVR
ncbi:MAG: hypothetical protein GWN93_06065 [Deltaproteobacteria bacterium]|nr:hypothetical protein [Deltaproteobacteria bacterium]